MVDVKMKIVEECECRRYRMVWYVVPTTKLSAIEIDSSIWREEIGNRNRLIDLAGRNCK